MRRRLLLLVLAFCLPALSACSAMLEREYYLETPHTEQSLPDTGSVLVAENYEEMVDGLRSFVSRRMENGVIRLYNLEGEVTEAAQAACLEVTRADPFGAYAVDNIFPEPVRIVSYYEISFTIVYRRTARQPEDIADAVGDTAMRRAIAGALESFSETLTLYNAYFFSDEASLRALAREAYFSQPESAMGLTGLAISFYPAEGPQRIIEFTFQYPGDAQTLSQRRSETLRAVRELALSVAGEPPERRAALLRDALRESAVLTLPDPEAPLGASAWNVLADGAGCDASFALAYKLLCDAAELPCVIASGTRDGAARFWNIVTANGVHAHADTADEAPGFYSDEAYAALGYAWRETAYPACGGWEDAPAK